MDAKSFLNNIKERDIVNHIHSVSYIIRSLQMSSISVEEFDKLISILSEDVSILSLDTHVCLLLIGNLHNGKYKTPNRTVYIEKIQNYFGDECIQGNDNVLNNM